MAQTFDQVVFQTLRAMIELSIETNPRPIEDTSNRLPLKFKHLRKHGKRNDS